MVAHQGDPDEVPSPALVAAWKVLKRLDPARVPTWAAWWIVQGHDGDVVCQLAGLSGQDPYDVHDLLPLALSEMGVLEPSLAQAVQLAFDHEAKVCLAGEVDERTVARFVEDVYIDAGYPTFVLDEPLGEICGVDDEWEGGWGRQEDGLRRAVRTACLAQLSLR
jgi:hypothetical protein